MEIETLTLIARWFATGEERRQLHRDRSLWLVTDRGGGGGGSGFNPQVRALAEVGGAVVEALYRAAGVSVRPAEIYELEQTAVSAVSVTIIDGADGGGPSAEEVRLAASRDAFLLQMRQVLRGSRGTA